MIVDAIFQKMELATTPERVNYENGQQIPLDTVKVAPTSQYLRKLMLLRIPHTNIAKL